MIAILSFNMISDICPWYMNVPLSYGTIIHRRMYVALIQRSIVALYVKARVVN
jgi:hypothetical protein